MSFFSTFWDTKIHPPAGLKIGNVLAKATPLWLLEADNHSAV
jgi:hypothetical protein